MDRTFEEYKKIVDDHLFDFIPNVDTKSLTLYEAMKYSLAAGGKRLRPILTLAACDFMNGDIYEALPYACAIEYIHTYSLIHDDLPCMDDDDLRRGVPTNHKVYGEAIALLAGDGLLTSAFEAIHKDQMLYFDDPKRLIARVKAGYTISNGAGVKGMVAGQICDIEGETKKYSNTMLEYLHLNKTGALIKSSIRAGLYIGNADSDTISRFDKYSEALGLAFQIQDDILDVTGSVEELGKDVNADERSNKNSFVSVNGLDKAKKRLNELTEDAISALSVYYDNAEFFTKLALDLKNRNK
ncbi:MAG: polyprenyl synthetase family protein [Clostridia bacterium]|nr:polyprenyl synthetase family protein [Clostridia bacterium]